MWNPTPRAPTGDDVFLDAGDVGVAQRSGEASLDDVEIDLGGVSRKVSRMQLAASASPARFAVPHAHRAEACVGRPPRRSETGAHVPIGGEVVVRVNVGLTAARAERDVDLGRIDHYPGGTSSSSLPVRVCSVWLRASTSSWIRASQQRSSGSKCSGRAGDSPPLCSRPACMHITLEPARRETGG